MIKKLCSKNSADKSEKSSAVNPAVANLLIKIGKQLLAESDVDKILPFAMDRAIEISGAERGMIILCNENDEFLFATARNSNKTDITNPKSEISYTIIHTVIKKGESICLTNAFDNPMFRNSNSVSRLKILAVICVPLVHNEKIFGTIYLDNRSVTGAFSSEIYSFVKTYTDFITLAAYQAHKQKRLDNKINTLEVELRGNYCFESIIGHHPKMVEILKLVAQIADTNATVIIQGESGTGKELIARALHYNSIHKNKPFVPINCAALPENLLESELFGHVRGAFTGAVNNKIGWFERAEGGTIFLDEVGEMTPALQVKLLRVLQTGEYSRVGSTEICHCNVRLIAATNKNLLQLVKQGKFREEVYYRLNVIDICLPPLRERKCDIPLLIQHFVKKYCNSEKITDRCLSPETETLLLAHDYPGNIRELENIIQRTIVLAEDKYIEPRHLPACVRLENSGINDKTRLSCFRIAKQQVVATFERKYIADCLQAAKGNISCAAKTAGINVKNFYEKMKKYGINPHQFKTLK